ncbi:DUF6531 domain-containing protein, partial [Ferviditalea candida]|nr:DUF6531 domain-containing protein [Paenibacillaceae bacterium T2]
MELIPSELWLKAGSLLPGLAERGVRAEAASLQGPSWVEPVNETESPKYYTFDDVKVLSPRPKVGEEKVGGPGANIKALETEPAFSPKEGAAPFVIKWEDTLSDWVASQEGEPLNAPSGYTVTLKLKEIRTGEIYTLLSGSVDHYGTNNFNLTYEVVSEKEIPDGFYYWILEAEAPTVSFLIPSEDPETPPSTVTRTAPAYGGEYTRVILDRVAPEIVGVHPLGDGKLAVEAKDGVSGLQHFEASGSSVSERELSSFPQHAAYAAKPGDGETLQVAVKDMAGNETTDTLPLRPFVTDLGDQAYIPQAAGTVAGQQAKINLTGGNGIQHFKGFKQITPGFDLDFSPTYNHQNRVKGAFGYGWSFTLDSRIKKWSEDDLTWSGFDGTVYWFHKENGEYVTYAGGQKQYYPQLTYYPDAANPNDSSYVMEWPDQLRYRFTDDGRFWMIQDRYQNETFFSWIKWPTYHGIDYRIETITDSAGRKVQFQYTPDTGNVYSTIIKEIDGAGNQTGTYKKFFFMYNQAGEFVGYREPSQKIIRFTYDALHRIDKIIDNGNNHREKAGEEPDSKVTDWQYDGQNRVTSIQAVRKQDQVKEFVDVAYGEQQAEVTTAGGSAVLKWNEAGRLTERIEQVDATDGEQRVQTQTAKWTYTYSRNQLIGQTDPLERTTKTRYDAKGNRTGELRPSGLVLEYAYDQDGDLLSEKGTGGVDVSYSYVKNGRKIVSRTKTVTIADPYGIQPPRTVTTREGFLPNGQIDKRTDGEGNVFQYQYDHNFFPTDTGREVTYTYDENGNVLTETRHPGTPDEAVYTYAYNPVGLIQHAESPTGRIDDYVEYDNFGRLKKLVQTDKKDSSKRIVRAYEYNDGDSVIYTSDGLTKSNYTYDGAGRILSKVTVPMEAGTEGKLEKAYEYNTQGLLSKETDERGNVKEIFYNIAGEPVEISELGGAKITLQAYDDAGRLKSVTHPDGSLTEYEYDAWDRVTKKTETVKTNVPAGFPVQLGELADRMLVTEYRYNSIGQLLEEKGPGGNWTRYAYDGNGSIASETVGGKAPVWGGYTLASNKPDTLYPGDEVLSVRTYQYDRLGRIVEETDGNGYTTRYAYTGGVKKVSVPAFDAAGNLTVYTRQTHTDPDGRIIETVDPSEDRTVYEYDAFGNRTRTVNPGGQEIVYQTDAYGRNHQRTEQIDATGKTQTHLFDVDAWGHMREHRVQLNASEWAVTTTRYNAVGDLLRREEPSGLIEEYVYDAQGRVTSETITNPKPDGSAEIRLRGYVYDVNGNEIMRRLPDGSKEYDLYDTAGNKLVAVDAVGTPVKYTPDAQGNITDITLYGKKSAALIPQNVESESHNVLNAAGNLVLNR